MNIKLSFFTDSMHKIDLNYRRMTPLTALMTKANEKSIATMRWHFEVNGVSSNRDDDDVIAKNAATDSPSLILLDQKVLFHFNAIRRADEKVIFTGISFMCKSYYGSSLLFGSTAAAADIREFYLLKN